eukprot:COSAG01_NODE_21390_length_904_cov_1.216149_2_plen_79_part_00
MLPRVAWQDATSDACVMEPALQHPRPVVSDQPKPAVQPHWSGYEVELPADDAEQSVLPRVAWQDATSDACVIEREWDE